MGTVAIVMGGPAGLAVGGVLSIAGGMLVADQPTPQDKILEGLGKMILRWT
jgi:hypothetical protein